MFVHSEYGLDGLTWYAFAYSSPLLILGGFLMLISMEFYHWKPELFIAKIFNWFAWPPDFLSFLHTMANVIFFNICFTAAPMG